MSAFVNAKASGLTPDQITQAQTLSKNTHWLRARALLAAHPLGLQTLSIEKQERKNHFGARWVSVYQYHYTLQSARVLLVDLQTNAIIKQSTIDSVHLPLNNIEIEFAKSLISEDSELIEQLRREQILRGKTPLESLDDLDVKASIYEPLNTTNSCQVQRCALVSLFDKTRTVFRIEPVVNLSILKVGTLESQ
jgi:hypothetical protein